MRYSEIFSRNVLPLLILSLAAGCLAGCGGSYDDVASNGAAAPGDSSNTTATTPDDGGPSETDAANPDPAPSSESDPEADPASRPDESPDEPEDTERVAAAVGVGKKGRSLDNETGVIVEPAKSLFAFKERAVFEIQIPKALQLYQATNGRGPQSHEDFMQDIIQANQIKLPELPAGQRYVYDPQSEQLMVQRPKP